MSGQLVMGVAGAFIGAAIPGVGAAIGWTVGVMLGAMLFPVSGPDGPRLEDLRVQGSEYGRPIPIVYGTVALGGNIIWATDLVEVATEVDVGGGGFFGGGTTQTIYSYYGNFAVAVCEGNADISLGRIWAGADKRLIWDGTNLEGGTLRFYKGTEDQLPDPLIEAHEGVGNAPAYRGTAYVVFENFPLEKDFNRLPQLTIEVGHADTAPAALGTVDVYQVLTSSTYYMAFYGGANKGVVVRRLDNHNLLNHYSTYIADPDWPGTDSIWFYDHDRERIVRCKPGWSFEVAPLSTGVRTTHSVTVPSGGDSTPGYYFNGGLYLNGVYVFLSSGGYAPAGHVTVWLIDPDTYTVLGCYGKTSEGSLKKYKLFPATIGGQPHVCAFSHPQKLKAYPLTAGGAVLDLGAPAEFGLYSQIYAGQDPYTGYIWSYYRAAFSSTVEVRVNNPATQSLVATFTTTVPYATRPYDYEPWGFTPGGKAYFGLVNFGSESSSADILIDFTASPPALNGLVFTGDQSLAWGQSLAYNSVAGELMQFRHFAYVAETDAVSPGSLATASEANGRLHYLGGAAAGPGAGEPIASVVRSLCERAGIASTSVNVDALGTEIVDGYAVARQTTVREAMTALMPAYFFDAVESSGAVKFVKRGGRAATTIPDEDLAAAQSGSGDVELLESVRQMENELPRVVAVNYLRAATNYDKASKQAQRLVGSSGDESTMDLPLVLSDTKAQEIAEVNLHGAWIERLSYRFSIPLRYSFLEPTDVVIVRGVYMRLDKITRSDGVLRCEARRYNATVYDPTVIVTETPAVTQSVSVMSDTAWEIA